MAGAILDRIPGAARKFSATNARFKEDATLDVLKRFAVPIRSNLRCCEPKAPRLYESECSTRYLEAENETNATLAKQQIDIVPANYSFNYLGREDCDGRACYRLSITPKRKEKYLIDGQIWIDAVDWGIVRVQGSPAKRPSFWVRQTQFDIDTSASRECG